MKHINQPMSQLIERANKAKFYYGNENKFLRYFDSLEQYHALILAGNFKKMEQIIEKESDFNLGKFFDNL